MIKNLTIMAGTAALGFALATPAMAMPSTEDDTIQNVGSVSFSGDFDTKGNIVSDLTSYEIADPGDVKDVVGFLAGIITSDTVTTFDIDVDDPTGFIYQVDGLTFVTTVVEQLATSPLECDTFGCQDSVELGLSGIVQGLPTAAAGGFDDVEFSGKWTAQGSCSAAAGDPLACTEPSSASWSASLSVTGTTGPSVPVPGTLALMGLGLLGLRAANRRKETA